ncbi:TlpA family protein disulfide reductase [Psychroserpens ponticola]|uniref:TlpA disulfide reductase family protein n=1 Tax=Psychroserpens ponticola TaxID=2932268 RepID=A0ABY7RUX8_9FLAO|nr:TlpA disulfide reductase family protein [Psychroserpens ponticola]WCO00909.1 TlpA disulfide reductase family protein [Psychroserpens ponticola]
MKYTLVIVLLVFFSCKEVTEKKEVADVIESPEVELSLEVYDFEGIQKYLSTTDDKTYIINFWATWCAPCVKELPYFEKLNKEYVEDVEVILVSLDFPSKYETKLKPYIKSKNLQSKVIALNDVDSNSWIPKVDESWTGAIPATVIFNKNERKFYEKSFNYDELETEVKQFLK